jgi:hypothetical protein
MILYFGLQKKLIKPIPRQILKSDIFSCPEELYLGLASLEDKITRGENINPHLSRKLKNLNNNDGLLFDWGIFHLHLGTAVEADGFVKRTGPLLYARFDNDNAYFINVINHGAWTTQDLVRTIHKNWPSSIETYRLKGETKKFSTNINDESIKELRGNQINTILEIEDGVFYLGPGGGLTGSGSSAEAMLSHLQNMKRIKRLEKSMNADITKFLLSIFSDLNFIENEVLNFELKKDNGKFHIDELNNEFQILLNN